MLDLLTVFHRDIRIVITDVVEYEVTHRTDMEDANIIRAFLSRNEARVQVDETSFAGLLKTIRIHPDIELPSDAGELSIYSYVSTVKVSNPGEATLVLFEDDWFLRNHVRPGNVHLLSTRAFLDGLERLAPEFPAESALRRILRRRPTLQAAIVDESASKIADGTQWGSSVDREKVKKVGKRLR